MDAPRQSPSGTPVPMTLSIRNSGPHPVELYLTGRPAAFDITVSGRDGTVVWRRLHGQIVPAILQILELLPNESLEMRDEWTQSTNSGVRVEPGIYAVQGELLTPDPDRRLRTGVITIEIVTPACNP